MSHLDQHNESCSPKEYQNPPPSEEVYKYASAYQYPASSNSSVIPSSMSYDNQFIQPDGYPQDPHAEIQQSPSDCGRGELGNCNGSQHMSFAHSAPRQRAAIACRYCRRRKIRCSGSGENVQGRCKNCQRFQQDCIFVPVSPYVQAFVPAHLAYPQMPNMGVNSDGGVHLLIPGQQRYGAYGQPLSQITPTTADLGSYAAVPPKELSSDFADETIGGSRKRRHIELHPSILPPPPFPGQFHHGQISAKRPATEANLLLDTTTPAARLGLQQTPIRSPKPYVSSNSELPNILLSMSQSRIPPPNSYPSERLHPIASVNIDSRASEIDRYMLGRLDGKKD